MRKLDEIRLYAAVRYSRDAGILQPVDEIAKHLGIPEKRALSLAEKWNDKGWVECGLHIRWCWFTDKAPRALLEWGVLA